jgi:2'-5' RNA ligase
MRLFVALDIEAGIRERITAFRNQLRPLAPDVRWVSPETYHVTLQFLGETKKIAEIRDALGKVSSSPITLSYRGAGFFPTPRSPRVFWVGIEGDRHLQALADAIALALAPLEFERDHDKFTPHLTLARVGSGRPRPVRGERPAPSLQRVREQLEKSPPPDFGTMTAHEFILYESHLSPAGPRYEKRASFPLRPQLTASNNA